MAKTPDQAPLNQQNSSSEDSSAFKPVAPIIKPAFIPEPEPAVNPFVALKAAQAGATPPSRNKPKDLPPDIASLLEENIAPAPVKQLLPARPVSKPEKFLLEDVTISIAPEFAPPPPPPAPKQEMDFSLDYKNPEADTALKVARDRQAKGPCFKCNRSAASVTLLQSKNGPICINCHNPYVHRLNSGLYTSDDPLYLRATLDALTFCAVWLLPLLPALLWYSLFIHTGFGNIFEDLAVLIFAPSAPGLVFLALFLLGVFLIPACIVAASFGKTVSGLMTLLLPQNLFPLAVKAMPGYFLTFLAFAGTLALNLAILALGAEAGLAWAGTVPAVLLAVCMCAGEMGVARMILGSFGNIKK